MSSVAPLRPLGDFCDIQLGKMLSPKARTGLTSAPYLRNANVQWDRFDLNDVAGMDFSPEERLKFALRPGDLLVCEGGEPGRAAVWQGQLEGCFYQKALHRVRPDLSVALPRYLMYRLWFASMKGEFSDSHAKTTIAHLPAVRLAQLPIALPAVREQARIVEALDRAFAEITRARQAARDRAGMSAVLVGDIFEAVKKAAAAHGPTVSLSSLAEGRPDAFADGPFGSHLASAHYSPDGARVIRLQNIGRGEFLNHDAAFIPLEHYRTLIRHRVAAGDVLVAALGDGVRPAGRACLAPENLGPALVKADCFRVRLPTGRVDKSYLVAVLNAPSTLRLVASFMRGATRPRVTLGILKQLTLPAPTVEYQRRLMSNSAAVASGRKVLSDAEREQNRALDSLPAAILREAFAGRL